MKNAIAWITHPRNSNLVLTICKDNKYGLIGGKINAGETPNQALVREITEETGLNIQVSYEPFIIVNETGCWLVSGYAHDIPVDYTWSSPEGTISWQDHSVLLYSHTSNYSEYNRKALKQLD